MSIGGHVSREMLDHYSHIRLEAKRRALEGPETPVPEPEETYPVGIPPVPEPSMEDVIEVPPADLFEEPRQQEAVLPTGEKPKRRRTMRASSSVPTRRTPARKPRTTKKTT